MYQNNFPFKRYQITVDFIKKHIGKNEFILDLGVENPLSNILRDNGFKIDNCETQRNLDQIGISQSKKIGELFREKKIKIDQVLSSQWCRCKDTARYAFENFKEFPALNSTFSPPYDKNEKKQIKELRNFVQEWDGQGGNLILVTHYVVILAMTGQAPSSGEIVIANKDFRVLATIKTF